MFLNDNSTLLGRAGQLVENALALAPTNPKALFYSGLAAAQRSDTRLAADRWDALLATAPPPEIEDLLRQRVAEWRGEAPAPAPAPSPRNDPLTIKSLGASAASAVDPGTTVFIIARDPAQPSPPIAAVRRANELPSEITLTDSDMIPGRLLSGFDKRDRRPRVGERSADGPDGRLVRQRRGEHRRVPTAEHVIDQQVP